MRLIDADAIPEKEMNYPVWVCLKKQPTIDAVPRPSYRVPTKEEWRERYCTNKQLAGIRHRERRGNNT